MAAQAQAHAAPSWSVSDSDIQKYKLIFNRYSKHGYVQGAIAPELFKQLTPALDRVVLARIWKLADAGNDGKLDYVELIIAIHLALGVSKLGYKLPSSLPPPLQHNNIHSLISVAAPTMLRGINRGNSHEVPDLKRPAYQQVQPHVRADPAPIDPWGMNKQQVSDHMVEFLRYAPHARDKIGSDLVKPALSGVGVSDTIVQANILKLADLTADGKVDFMEFAIAMQLAGGVARGKELPPTLPRSLAVDSIRDVVNDALPPAQIGKASSVDPTIATGTPKQTPKQLAGRKISTEEEPQRGSAEDNDLTTTNKSSSRGPSPQRSQSVMSPQPGSPRAEAFAVTTNDIVNYRSLFEKYDKESKSGFIHSNQANTVFDPFGIHDKRALYNIWHLADSKKRGKLDFREFIVGVHLATVYKKKHIPVPTSVPFALLAQNLDPLIALAGGGPWEKEARQQANGGKPTIDDLYRLREEKRTVSDKMAASQVQSRFRQLASKVTAQKKSLWNVWNELDKKEESELAVQHKHYLKLRNAYSKLVGYNENDIGSMPDIHARIKERIGNIALQLQTQPREGMSGGFSIASLPILQDEDAVSVDFVKNMIDEFKCSRVLAYENVWQILKRVYPLLGRQPNIVPLTISEKEGARVNVVGDIHGQLDDLLTILNLAEFPNEGNMYVFNGDFVDRGQYCCECVLVMLSLKIAYPNYVFLNRGNHEAADINALDGFEKEVLDKYDRRVFGLFSDVFACLPIATLIQKKVYVVHGGLSSQDVSFDFISKINRFVPIPVTGSVLSDLLWSDPADINGRQRSERGAGCKFGGDVCTTFMKANGLRLIIRSHECVDNGYEVWFGGKLITVFSASNYCGDTGNLGAFIQLSAALKVTIKQYMATPQVEKLSTRYDKLEKNIISKLLVRVVSNRTALEKHWQSVAGPDGKISRIQWSEGLNSVLGLHVPFLLLAKQLGISVTVGSRIDFMQFLERFKPSNDRLEGAAPGSLRERLSELLFQRRFELEALFRHFDQDKSGSISKSELKTGLSALADVLGDVKFAESDIDKLCEEVDQDGNGEIDYDEFFQAFALGNYRIDPTRRGTTEVGNVFALGLSPSVVKDNIVI